MGLAIDTQAGYTTAPGGTLTALTAGTGQSFAVKNFAAGSAAYLEGIIRSGAEAGEIRYRSPMMHDLSQGSHFAVATGKSDNLMRCELCQPLRSGDIPTFEVSGAAALSDVGVVQYYYQDLPGAAARLYNLADISPLVLHVLGYKVAAAASATIGSWGDVLVNVTYDVLMGDHDYAVLGYETDTAVGAVAIYGPDTANMRVGGPGLVGPVSTRDYFVRQSAQARGERTALP